MRVPLTLQVVEILKPVLDKVSGRVHIERSTYHLVAVFTFPIVSQKHSITYLDYVCIWECRFPGYSCQYCCGGILARRHIRHGASDNFWSGQ